MKLWERVGILDYSIKARPKNLSDTSGRKRGMALLPGPWSDGHKTWLCCDPKPTYYLTHVVCVKKDFLACPPPTHTPTLMEPTGLPACRSVFQSGPGPDLLIPASDSLFVFSPLKLSSVASCSNLTRATSSQHWLDLLSIQTLSQQASEASSTLFHPLYLVFIV